MLSFLFLLFFSDDNPSSNLLQGALGSFPVAQGKKIIHYTPLHVTIIIRCLAVPFGELPYGHCACQSLFSLFTTCFDCSFVFIIYVTGSDDEDTDAAQLMSLPVLLQRSVMAPLLAQ